jgi:hypothetical protein
MLEMAEKIAALRRELGQLRDRGGKGSPDDIPDERPPHY